MKTRKLVSFLLILSLTLVVHAEDLVGRFLAATQTKEGITFFFPGGTDEGIYITFVQSEAIFRYLDGRLADGSLQKKKDRATYKLSSHSLTISGDFLTRELSLELSQAPTSLKSTKVVPRPEFVLKGDSLPFGGTAPALLPGAH